MGKSGPGSILVTGANIIQNIHYRHRCTHVLVHNDFQAIVELKSLKLYHTANIKKIGINGGTLIFQYTFRPHIKYQAFIITKDQETELLTRILHHLLVYLYIIGVIIIDGKNHVTAFKPCLITR